MKHIHLKSIAIALMLALLTPQGAVAAQNCYVDYKAKRIGNSGAGLKLHYGVIALPPRICNNGSLGQAYVTRQLKSDGWALLRVISRFSDDGLNQRRQNAGQYFLRY
jgi:hypothetical protein